MANSNTIQHQGWGGEWTEQKLDCFESYVKAYLTIMNAYRDKFHWKLLYFDGFAGCGDRVQEEEGTKAANLFGEALTDVRELRPYQGAAERVLQLEKDFRGFDYYYLIDKFDENLTKLELKLATYQPKGLKIFRPGDANSQIAQMADYLRSDKGKNTKVLCLLDPFGMSIDWESIVRLAGNGMDLWILVPTGSIVNRLIQNDGTLRYPERLERFFGLPAEVIHDRFYEERNVPADLFDTDRTEVRKVKNIISEIAQLYCEQLGTVFQFVTQQPLVMYNSNHLPIFHFVFASNNETAGKIAKQIIDKRQKK